MNGSILHCSHKQQPKIHSNLWIFFYLTDTLHIMKPVVQIQIVTWNSAEHLESVFAGIARQTEVPFSVVVIDNNSSDGTIEWIQQNHPEVTLIQNTENKGFAGGHNQGIDIAQTPYVLVLNPDCELQEGYIAQATAEIEKNEHIGSIAGKLYRILPNNGKSGIFDSCGLHMTIYGKVYDRGENIPENAKFSLSEPVFGTTGACALYRVEALKSVQDAYGYFDERFHAYKEDVDLAWRLHKKGWICQFVPQAIAQHDRAVQKGNRHIRSQKIQYLSLRNHLIMLKKNLGLRDVYKFPFILIYEMLKAGYTLVRSPQLLKAYVDAIRA